MMNLFKSDIEKYKRYSSRKMLFLVLTQQGLWALCLYRFANSVYRKSYPSIIKKSLLFFCVIWQKGIEILTGISIPYTVTIGHSFYIGHFGNIIINATAVIGNNCNISQGVTIGVSGRGVKRGVPKIGDNVYIGANAVISGSIIIGDDVVIGANSLVINDVPDAITVVGVPASKFSDKSSKDYL